MKDYTREVKIMADDRLLTPDEMNALICQELGIIDAQEARQISDTKKSETFINKAEKAIRAATNKGEYYAIIENTTLKSVPESAIKQLKV